MRVGELRNLTTDSVDFEHGVVNVRRQVRADKKIGRTKTRAGRRQIPIEANVEPLLRVLVEAVGEGGSLLRLPPAEDCAEKVREDLLASGVDREDVFADDGERQHFTFHGLRHTCITHWAVAGRGVQWLAAAGHTDLNTTQGYVDTGLLLRGSFGQPHPPLPPELVVGATDPELWRNYGKIDPKLPESLRSQRELNPCYRRERPVS